MAPWEGQKQSSRGPASKREAEEEDSSPASERADELEVEANILFQDLPDDDEVIQNLNAMGRMKLMMPDWIENAKQQHRMHISFVMQVRDEMAEDRRKAAAAAAQSTV